MQKYDMNSNEWFTVERDPKFSDPLVTITWDKKDYIQKKLY